MKKLIAAALTALLLIPLAGQAADFMRLDSASYDAMWAKGKTVKKHGLLENPMHYGLEMRHGTIGSNQVVLVTPYTAGMYISSTEDLRLLQVPEDFKDTLLANQDMLFITTSYMPVHHLISYSMETKGSARPEHFAIEKDGKRIYPHAVLHPAIDALMPHSYFATYFGYSREEILDVPYTVKYVNGEGDLIEFPVTEKTLARMLKQEQNFEA